MSERDMPSRLLRLLALLQSGREWTGAELAHRLGVTDRTLRRYVDRLRGLDYPIDAVSGAHGGYRLATGAALPPLLLDVEEAVAVATGLTVAGGGGVAGNAEAAERALGKLEQVLPARVRPRLTALAGAAAGLPVRRLGPDVDPVVLDLLATCCHDREIVSFAYRGRSAATVRRVEPHSLVTVRGLWYLVAYDPDRTDWRTFRIDRIDDPRRTHRRAPDRELPAPDAATHLARSFAGATYRHTATMAVALPAETLRTTLFSSLHWQVDDDGPDACTVRLSAETVDLVTQYVAAIASLGAEFTLDAPAEITERVRAVGRRLAR